MFISARILFVTFDSTHYCTMLGVTMWQYQAISSLSTSTVYSEMHVSFFFSGLSVWSPYHYYINQSIFQLLRGIMVRLQYTSIDFACSVPIWCGYIQTPTWTQCKVHVYLVVYLLFIYISYVYILFYYLVLAFNFLFILLELYCLSDSGTILQ